MLAVTELKTCMLHSTLAEDMYMHSTLAEDMYVAFNARSYRAEDMYVGFHQHSFQMWPSLSMVCKKIALRFTSPWAEGKVYF